MAFGDIVVGFPSEMIDHVDVEAESSLAYSVVNGYEPSSPSHNSSTGSSKEPAEDGVEVCQCPLPACGVCGSFIERGSYCPQLCDVIILED